MKKYAQHIEVAPSAHITLAKARQVARAAKSARPGDESLVLSSPHGRSLYRMFLGTIEVPTRQGTQYSSSRGSGGSSRKSASKYAAVLLAPSAKKKATPKKRAAVAKKSATKKKAATKK